MSIKIMEAVWKLEDIDSTKTLIFLCLADNANAEGFCWPSYKNIMKRSKVKSKVTMAKHLKDLENMGYICSQRRQRSNKRLSNIYQINLEKLGILDEQELFNYEGTENVLTDLEGTENVPPKVQKMNLTYMNRILEPSLSCNDASASDDVGVKATKKKGNCPHQKIIDMYHEILPMLPKTKIITKKVETLLNGRWEERRKAGKYDSVDKGIAYWEKFFRFVERSKWLTGQVSDFKANIRWLFNEENFAKTIDEKKYHREEA